MPEMAKKQISIGELGKILAEGPVGEEKIKRLTEAATTLAETISLMAKRQRPYEIPTAAEDNTIRFGLIGDTQIGSLYQRLDALKEFYAYCADQGIDTMLHAGDVIDGWRVYRGQEFELHPNARSWPEQRDMFADSMPRIDGLKTIFITGNHDVSFKKLVGLIVGDELQRVRPDWKFIGQDIGDVVFKTKGGNKLTVQMLHPGGGTAYADSYRLQKIIESISGGQKPDIIAVGHYHKALWEPNYRNVSGFLVGTFQSQTPFMIQRSLAAHIGGWIVTAVLGERKKLTTRVSAEFISFFEQERGQ
jgi:hypothetical protein